MARQEKVSRHRNRIFPIFGVIVLLIGIVWFLNALNLFTISVPWIPLVLIVIGIGMIVNHYYRRR
jgi:predicted RND superfamily exporter protein